jgi:hypothetical protein
LSLAIFIMNDGQRVRPPQDVFKVATCLRMPTFDQHCIRGRAQNLNREPDGRVEKRVIDGSSAVSNVQNLHVNSGA